MSVSSIREYASLRIFLQDKYMQIWITNHAIRPVSLFVGVSQRVSIVITRPSIRKELNYTKYLRTTKYLNILFSTVKYLNILDIPSTDGISPKISYEIEKNIFLNIQEKKKNLSLFSDYGKQEIHFKDYGETYWVFPFGFQPFLTPLKSFKILKFDDSKIGYFATIAFNSSLFYIFYLQISDCWHFGKWHMTNFPLDLESIKNEHDVIKLFNELMKNYKKNRITRYDSRINGDLYEYKIYLSKHIIDQIDCLLAQHYGFTHEELDFIINYDIKYRMGKELNSDEEDEE
jgi:hypothetical protein